MVLCLQMNGTSDYIKCPSITFNQVILDVSIQPVGNAYYFDARTGLAGGYLTYTTSNYYQAGYTWNTVQVNGTTVANKSDFNFPSNTRTTITLSQTSAGTDDVNIFSTSGAVGFGQGNIYDVKFYNGSTLVAHYDFSSSANISGTTILDTSGNGYNATFYGGTPSLVNDGASSSTTYIGSGTSQGTSNATSNETLISNSGTTYSGSATSQSAFSAVSNENQINSSHTQSQATSQAISNDKLSLSASTFSQGQSSAISTESFVQHGTTTYSGSATSQASSSASSSERVVYEVKGISQSVSSAVSSETVRYFVTGISLGESSASSTESFISVQSIISRVTLQGSRELHITLQGNRQLVVVLNGGVDVPAENQDFEMYAGEDKILDIPNITDPKATLDLTTCQSIYFIAKKGSGRIYKDLTNGVKAISATEINISLKPSDTSNYVAMFDYEVWCTDSQGYKSILTTGILNIKKSLPIN